MRPKKTPLRMCAGCGEMKPKKELVRVVKAPQKEDEHGNPLPPEISLDSTGKRPGRGAYLCRDAQCLKLAKKSRRLERSFSCKIPEEVYQRLEEEMEKAAREQEERPVEAPSAPLDQQGRPIIEIEEAPELLPRKKGGGHGG